MHGDWGREFWMEVRLMANSSRWPKREADTLLAQLPPYLKLRSGNTLPKRQTPTRDALPGHAWEQNGVAAICLSHSPAHLEDHTIGVFRIGLDAASKGRGFRT